MGALLSETAGAGNGLIYWPAQMGEGQGIRA